MSPAEKLQMVTVAILAAAAFFSWRSVAIAKKTAAAQLAKSLLDQYASKDFSEAVRRLAEFGRESGYENNVIPFVVDHFKAGTTVREGSELDEARRVVHWYFKNAWMLYEQKLLAKPALQLVLSTHAYQIFHEIAAPLSWNTDSRPNDRGERWAWYERLRSKFPPDKQRVWLRPRE